MQVSFERHAWLEDSGWQPYWKAAKQVLKSLLFVELFSVHALRHGADQCDECGSFRCVFGFGLMTTSS